MEPLDRMKRIAELQALINTKKNTPEQMAEFRKLLDEQMAWAKANPAKAMEAQQTFAIMQKTPEQMKAEFETAKAEHAATAPVGKLTAEQEQARTDAGKAARAKAIAEGKSVAVADAIALDVYTKWRPTPVEPAPAPAPVAPAPAPAPAPVASAPVAPAPVTPAPAPEPEPEIMTVDSSAPMVGIEPEPKAPVEEPKKKKKFGEMAGDLYNKYGVPILEIVEAVGKQRGGIDKPTHLDKKYAEKLSTEERDYMKKLEEERTNREEANLAKRLADQRAWEEAQTKAQQAFETGASATDYTQREKLLKMQLEAQKAATRVGGGTSASIIPD